LGRLKSKTYCRRMSSVLEHDELSALVARMSVLFEDLRIEYHAAQLADKIDVLDVLPSIYRKFYFLRRSTITLVEFMGSFQLLDQLREFQMFRAEFDETARQRWQAARDFFKFGDLFRVRCGCRSLWCRDVVNAAALLDGRVGRHGADRATASLTVHHDGHGPSG
jgi:hypothetical protein